MKGKKTDPIFISEFIRAAVQSSQDTPDEIVKRAKSFLADCDRKIKEAEVAKAMRSKYLDVIATFEKPVKDKAEEAKLLEFFNLKNPQICHEICVLIKLHGTIPITSFRSDDEWPAQYNFCIKQLLEAQVVMRANDALMRGEDFDGYMKFVLHEE